MLIDDFGGMKTINDASSVRPTETKEKKMLQIHRISEHLNVDRKTCYGNLILRRSQAMAN